MTEKWQLKGSYFESCNCEAACPCVFLSDPTQGDCTVVLAWHIDQGSFGEVRLDGLNVAAAIYSPGNMVEVPWQAALYFDNEADSAQMEALTQIFSGQVGGHPARLAEHIGEVMGVKQAPISYQAQDGQRRVQIGEVGRLEIKSIPGQTAQGTTIEGHPLAIAPGYPAQVARSKTLQYHDFGFDWELSEKTGFFSPFAYQGA
ncbi:MAG: DUF1326 domain-containing protein [Anaerolineales bacterium]|jgi:hypothetical protein